MGGCLSPGVCGGWCVVRAMLELRTPSETIDSLVSRCRDAHAVEFSCEDVSQSLDPSASLWVLDLAGG